MSSESKTRQGSKSNKMDDYLRDLILIAKQQHGIPDSVNEVEVVEPLSCQAPAAPQVTSKLLGPAYKPGQGYEGQGLPQVLSYSGLWEEDLVSPIAPPPTSLQQIMMQLQQQQLEELRKFRQELELEAQEDQWRFGSVDPCPGSQPQAPAGHVPAASLSAVAGLSATQAPAVHVPAASLSAVAGLSATQAPTVHVPDASLSAVAGLSATQEAGAQDVKSQAQEDQLQQATHFLEAALANFTACRDQVFAAKTIRQPSLPPQPAQASYALRALLQQLPAGSAATVEKLLVQSQQGQQGQQASLMAAHGPNGYAQTPSRTGDHGWQDHAAYQQSDPVGRPGNQMSSNAFNKKQIQALLQRAVHGREGYPVAVGCNHAANGPCGMGSVHGDAMQQGCWAQQRSDDSQRWESRRAPAEVGRQYHGGYGKHGMPPEAGDSLRMHLRSLSEVEPQRVLILRRIGTLGFSSNHILKEHYSWYGEVVKVLVAHSHVKSDRMKVTRIRPSGLGFMVMSSVEEADAILKDGTEQEVMGKFIRVSRYGQRFANSDVQPMGKEEEHCHGFDSDTCAWGA